MEFFMAYIMDVSQSRYQQSINTEVNTITIDGKENTTWTIFMVHQSPVSKEWCDLKIYSIPTEKVVDIEKFESKLRDMWIAFNKD